MKGPNHNSVNLKTRFERPVMVHRTILGLLDRMKAVLLEHYAGKWTFWMSQVSHGQPAYAQYVARRVVLQQFYADVAIHRTLYKKLREAPAGSIQLHGWGGWQGTREHNSHVEEKGQR